VGVTKVSAAMDGEVVPGQCSGLKGGGVTGSDDAAASGATRIAAARQDDVGGYWTSAATGCPGGQVVLSDGRVFDQQVPTAVGGQRTEKISMKVAEFGPAGGEFA